MCAFLKNTFSYISAIVITTGILSLITVSALAATPSNCVSTNVGAGTGNNCPTTGNGTGTGTGGPGATGNGIADYALALEAAIKSAGFPLTNDPVAGDVIVNSATQRYINSIQSNSTLNASGTFSQVLGWIRQDVNAISANRCYADPSIGCLQCVGFVQSVAIGTGKPLPSQNAGEFAQDLISYGYKWHPKNVTDPIQVGDIPVWTHHIAVATAVHANGWFDVREANGGNGSVGFDSYPQRDVTFPKVTLYYLGFLRKL